MILIMNAVKPIIDHEYALIHLCHITTILLIDIGICFSELINEMDL